MLIWYRTLQLVVPNINTAKILRYDPYMPKSENGLDNIKIETNNIFTKSVMKMF